MSTIEIATPRTSAGNVQTAKNANNGAAADWCVRRKRRSGSASVTQNFTRTSSTPAVCGLVELGPRSKAAVEDELDDLIEELIAERDEKPQHKVTT